MRRKKRIEVVLGGLFLAIALQNHSKAVYAKSEDTVKAVFENYIRETLIPQYGVLQTNMAESNPSHNWTKEDLCGILSANIMDFDDDGQVELLVIQFGDYDEENGIESMFLAMYEYQDSGEIWVGAQKKFEINGYSYRSIGYRQKCVFTYQYHGETYIGIDNFLDANGTEVAVSSFEYGKSGFEEMIVPHTNQVVYQTTFDYSGGVGYELSGNGDVFVRYTLNESKDPLSCSRWAWKKKYLSEIDPFLTDADKEEYMNSYKELLANLGLQAEDERIGMSQNGRFISSNEVEAFETALDIYSPLEGEITFLSGIYTSWGNDYTVKQLTKYDYQGSLDEFRNTAGQEGEG